MISRLTEPLHHLLSTLHDSRYRLPRKTRFRLAGCAFAGRESNPLGHGERFQSVHVILLSRACPVASWATNVGGIRNVLEAAGERTPRPWLLFASSREVYGQPERLPATEDTALRPVNVYGRSKAEGERLVEEAAARGPHTSTVRLSNVYGSARDHVDRVVPAFARAAATGSVIRMDGAGCTFDFTHIDDAVRGMVALIDRLEKGQPMPTVHLLTGRPTTLGELAAMANAAAAKTVPVVEAPARSFDVARFHGDPSRARRLLGWTPRVEFQAGFERLVEDLRVEADATVQLAAAP